MCIENVMEIIREDWEHMGTIEAFKEIIIKNNISYLEVLEAIKEYVKYYTDESVYNEYTDEAYIEEFLRDMCICSLNDGRYNDLYKYSFVLSNIFSD